MSKPLNPRLMQYFLYWYKNRRGGIYSTKTPRGVIIYRNAQTCKIIVKVYEHSKRCEVSKNAYHLFVMDNKNPIKRKLAV